MKFGIVIPLKSRRISRDWNVTSAALEATLESIKHQTNSNFVVAIAGHDCPDFLANMKDVRFKFVKVDYDAPDRNSPGFTNKELINDKLLKIMNGLIAIKEEPLSWIYQLDSDDLIRNDFIDTINSFPDAKAIIIEGGYVYYKSCNRIIETNKMDKLCGSIAIVKPNSFSIPPSADLKYRGDIPWTKYRHRSIYRFFEDESGSQCFRTSQKLLAYVLANGDNLSDRWRDNLFKKAKAILKPYIVGSKISPKVKSLFSIK